MKTDKHAQTMRQAWKEFGQSMKDLRTRLISLKEQAENKAREDKLKQIKRAIDGQN